VGLKEHFAAARERDELESTGYAPILGTVTRSSEFDRIMALPRRVLDLKSVQDLTPYFARTGLYSLRPIQSASLIEAAHANGLFAIIGVGYGKTLIGLALPEALDSKKTVYLVSADLKAQLQRETERFYDKHFVLPLDRIVVISYEELSDPRYGDVLDREQPDLVVGDEIHKLRNAEATRTKRFRAFFKDHPECRLAALSGTVTNRTPVDYAHLIELALRKNSPLPLGYRELRDWAGALAVKPDYRMRPGILKRFCKEGESVSSGFKRRLVETRGVVATEESAIGTSLIIRKLRLPLPPIIKELSAQVTKKWSLEEEEFEDATQRARALRQLATGFYYRWDWPGGEPDFEWLDARTAWAREVRGKLKYATKGMDSAALLAEAAERFYQWEAEGRPRPRPEKVWDSMAWPEWRLLRHREPPPTVAVWKHDFLVNACIAWAKRQDAPRIIWYGPVALGERIAQKGGFPLYGAGTDAGESTAETIVCSIAAQGTGKNLQHYCRNLLAWMPSNGTVAEQLIGRTHRPGQEADEVVVDWFGHTRQLEDSMAQIIEDAEYQQRTTGQQQKVLYADRINQ
jgi:hypothetical protein